MINRDAVPNYHPHFESESPYLILKNENKDDQPRKKIRKVRERKRAKAKALHNTGKEYVDKGRKLHKKESVKSNIQRCPL